MEWILNLLKDTALYLLNSLLHNAPALLIGILVAAAMKVYVDPDKMRNWLMRRSSVSIPATVAFGAFTPFCACGTMAVVLAMLATALPWGPVMAFLTSSPLMSPEEFVMMSGIVSPMFAVALAVASLLIGLGSGYITHVIEKKTHFLANQLRFAAKDADGPEATLPAPACGCGGAAAAIPTVSCCTEKVPDKGCGCGGGAEAEPGCGCGAVALPMPAPQSAVIALISKYKINMVARELFEIGIKKILPYFVLFAGIGYLINRLIPTTWISAVFGAQNVFAVPLAAVIGLPLYVNGDSAVPLIQSLLHSGVSGGALLAFMITGPGTSAGVLAGIATIMKKKAIALYAGFILAGGILAGYLFDLILAAIGR